MGKNKQPDFTFIPVASLRHNSIIVYDYYLGPRGNRTSFKKGHKPDNSAGFSLAVKKRISNAVVTWVTCVMSAKKERWRDFLTFGTVTLSREQKDSDKAIKRLMLNHFIITLKRKAGIRNYLWIAEKQKNGNLHFHLLLDRWIKHKDFRQYWNDVQNCNGYLGQNKNPNSTDIRNRSIKPQYFIKETVKQYQKFNIDGRMWGATEMVKTLRPYAVEIDGRLFEFIEDQKNKLWFRAEDQYLLLAGDYHKDFHAIGGYHVEEMAKYYKNLFDSMYN